MKTTVTILITGLVLMVTPMLASANSHHHRDHHDSYQGWTHHRDSDSAYDQHCDWQRNRYSQHRRRHEKHRLQRKLRETRHELRQAKRQLRRQRPYYAVQPYYVNPPVVFGIPQLVFRFGW